MRSDMQARDVYPGSGDGISRVLFPSTAGVGFGMRNATARIPIASFDIAIGRVASIRDAARGRKKFAQFLRKSGCAMPDRAAGRRRFVNTKTVSERVLRHLQRASMRNCTSRDAQMLREKNAFI
jgi:hypothetical protein